MNGLDAWDDLCFGTVRTRYTNDGYLVDYATAAVVAYSLSSGGSDAAPWTESGTLFQSVFKRNSATSINKPTNYVVGPLAQYVRVVKDMSDLLNFPSGKVVFVDWWIPEAGSSSTWHYFAHEPQQWYNLAEDTGATANPDFAFVDEAGAAAVQDAGLERARRASVIQELLSMGADLRRAGLLSVFNKIAGPRSTDDSDTGY